MAVGGYGGGYGDSGVAADPETATRRVRRAPTGKFWKAESASPTLCRERRACRAPHMAPLGDAAAAVARGAHRARAGVLSARRRRDIRLGVNADHELSSRSAALRPLGRGRTPRRTTRPPQCRQGRGWRLALRRFSGGLGGRARANGGRERAWRRGSRWRDSHNGGCGGSHPARCEAGSGSPQTL